MDEQNTRQNAAQPTGWPQTQPTGWPQAQPNARQQQTAPPGTMPPPRNPQLQQEQEQQASGGKRLAKKESRKARRQRWKAAKKQRRQQRKDFYRDAPFLTRIWHLYLWKPAAVLAVLLVLAAANLDTIMEKVFVPTVKTMLTSVRNKPLDPKNAGKIYELSPLDEDGAKRINAIAPVEAGETWTICVYMVGADLEDFGENDLSYVTVLQTAEEKQRLASVKQSGRMERLARFTSELNENGLELPAFFYYPDTPVASSTVVTDDVIVAEDPGCASTDIGEITSGVWPDRIKVVIQTGGAKRWSNQLVNPNRTQRFLYHGGQLDEVQSLPLQKSFASETLADFLRFCRDEYPADHQMLVLWNHGGGPFGYGNDSIFGGSFSLKDIRTALESAYPEDGGKPPFDIIGFDACLMSSLEVTHALRGFASYYAVSEETEPGEGWDYGPWLQAMTDDPTLNAAQIAMKIADSYTDHYMVQNVNLPVFTNDVTFSVLDADSAEELYAAYSALCEKMLVDAAEDISVLAEMGRCGSKATHYCGSVYNVYNLVDLGNYVDYLADTYPDECSEISRLIGKTVLYHRENGAVSDSKGISVYLPTDVNEVGGLIFYLDYIYTICEDDSVRALYYYKQAGCLNSETKEHLSTLTEQEPQILNTGLFDSFGRSEPQIESDGFLLPVSAKLQSMLVSYDLGVGCYDENMDVMTNYGTDEQLYLDGEGHLRSSFDGTWPCIDGVPMEIEVVSSTPSALEYRARVKYDGKLSYLMFSQDRDSGTLSLLGVREISNDGGINYLNNTRSQQELEEGKTIVPLYTVTNFADNSTDTKEGKSVRFSRKTQLTRELLPKGYYLCTAVISDQRGDSYYSNVVGLTVSGKGAEDWKLDPRFLGRGY